MVSSLKPGTVDVHTTVGHEIIQSPETRPDIISSTYCLPEFNMYMEDLRRRSKKKELEYHRMLVTQSADNARLERRQRQIRQMCEQYFEMKAKKAERSGDVDAAKAFRQPNRQLISPAETAQLLSTDCPSDSKDFIIPPNKRRKPSNQPGSSSEISNGGATDLVTPAGASAENATVKPNQPIANESEIKYDLSDLNLASSFVSDLNLPADVIEDDLNQPKALDNTGVTDGGTTGGVFQQQNAYNDGNNILKKDAVNSSTRLNSAPCQPAMVRYPYHGNSSNSYEYNPPTVRAPFFLPNDPAFFDHAPPNVSYVPSPEKHPPPPPSMINSGQTTSHHPMVMGNNISLPMNMQQLVRPGALPMSTGVVGGAAHYEDEYLPPQTPIPHHVAHHHHHHHHHLHQQQPQPQQQQQQHHHHHHQMGTDFRQNAMPMGARYSSVVDPYAHCCASSSQMQPMPQMGGAPPPNPVGMPMQATQYGGSYPTALSGQMNAAMFSGPYQQPVVRNPNMGYPVHQQVQYDSYRQPRDVGARFYQILFFQKISLRLMWTLCNFNSIFGEAYL
ncbi:Versican core protein [Trichinella spiralis]|uniref:Versican core protein n=1 Tax=Trichinella spiralis TaxID=6334 RepID=A0ABR3KD81_TRISP